MPYVDLHIHTCFSDGSQTPEEVAAVARDKALAAIAVCDHNTVEGLPRARDACARLGVGFVAGVELDVSWRQLNLHLLGYRFDPAHPAMTELLSRQAQEQAWFDLAFIANASQDHPALDPDDFAAYANPPGVGGWLNTNYLKACGMAADHDEAVGILRRYATYRPRYAAMSEACAAIRSAGGTPVLAHPSGWWEPPPDDFPDILSALRHDGIGGIECHYPGQSPALTEACRDFCRTHDLAITCGGDGHGTFLHPIKGVTYEIGVLKIPKDRLDLRTIW